MSDVRWIRLLCRGPIRPIAGIATFAVPFFLGEQKRSFICAIK